MRYAATNLLPLWEKDTKPYATGIRRSWMRGASLNGSRDCQGQSLTPHPASTKLTSFVKSAQPSPTGGKGLKWGKTA